MKRRALLLAVGATAASPAISVRAQDQRVRRIGFLNLSSAQAAQRMAAFDEAMRTLGWVRGGNIQVDYRVSGASPEQLRSTAQEIVAAKPEVVVVQSTPATRELLGLTRTIPVVFLHVSDPVGSGFVKSIARPDGNATGFTDTEASQAGKCLQLLKEMVPLMKRSALLFNPETAPGRGEFFYAAFEAAGRTLGVATVRAPIHNMREVDERFAALASEPGGGLVVTSESYMGTHSAEIVALANRVRLATVYPARIYAEQGGLLSFGTDSPDLYRRAAAYVDRILKGARPGDLPVQAPTRFERIVNLKTARATGIVVPPSILAHADQVIE